MVKKILAIEDVAQKANTLRRAGKRLVFTNGCFDILHAGHIRYLAAARSKGDILVVGLNSDESVKIIKDEHRPIMNQEQRAEILAGLWCVDYIIIFNAPDPLKLIEAIMPDVLVKGADWREQDIIGADVVKAGGGEVVRVSVVPDISTSRIIERIIKKYG
jgi:D-beta-D-heptose 7-phosphate kinase/D-beta-D-heptose 1-phosphate adenosyltransferase